MLNFSDLFFIIKKLFWVYEYCVIYNLGNKIDIKTINDNIIVYSEYKNIPNFIIQKLNIRFFLNPLFHRIKSKNAKLLCIYDQKDLIAYGWIQNWKPFKRKYGWLYKNATMLGPYWTNPDYRGKGIYGRLISHSIAISDKNLPLIIYTSPQNVSSQKGIEKAGFTKIGTFRILLVLRLFQWHKKID